jgi:hypothetical protein
MSNKTMGWLDHMEVSLILRPSTVFRTLKGKSHPESRKTTNLGKVMASVISQILPATSLPLVPGSINRMQSEVRKSLPE